MARAQGRDPGDRERLGAVLGTRLARRLARDLVRPDDVAAVEVAARDAQEARDERRVSHEGRERRVPHRDVLLPRPPVRLGERDVRRRALGQAGVGVDEGAHARVDEREAAAREDEVLRERAVEDLLHREPRRGQHELRAVDDGDRRDEQRLALRLAERGEPVGEERPDGGDGGQRVGQDRPARELLGGEERRRLRDGRGVAAEEVRKPRRDVRGDGEPPLDEQEVERVGRRERRDRAQLERPRGRVERARGRRPQQDDGRVPLRHEAREHRPAQLVLEVQVVGDEDDGRAVERRDEELGERDRRHLGEVAEARVDRLEDPREPLGDHAARELRHLRHDGDDGRPGSGDARGRATAERDGRLRELVRRDGLAHELERRARAHAVLGGPHETALALAHGGERAVDLLRAGREPLEPSREPRVRTTDRLGNHVVLLF